MNNQVSFADFFKLSPGLIEVDKLLDLEGSPVSYRKYLAVELLNKACDKNNIIQQLKKSMSDINVDAILVFSIWYNNVYGHVVYEPPASRFVAMSTPIPIIITRSPVDSEVTIQDITLIQYEVEESLSSLLDPEGFLLVGIQKLQNLPMAKWVWLAMADFDISVTSFELTRPSYHLSLWHSFQTLEKLLKAVLIALGEPIKSLQQYSHNIQKIILALNNKGVILTSRGIKIAYEISKLVGGPSVRYIDDSTTPNERLNLAKRSLRVHHLLLEFFSLDAQQIGDILSTSSEGSVFGFSTQNSDIEMRQKVHIEHKEMCSHSVYSKPPYALPLRQDITYPIKDKY